LTRKKLSIYIFVDALGWDLLHKHFPDFLGDLLPWRAPLGTVFGYSATCVPTILTGRTPREHGHLSFFRYDPQASPFESLRWLRFLPPGLAERGRVRRWMSRLVGRALGYSGYFQLYSVPFEDLALFDYTEKRDLFAPGGINGGCPTIFDLFAENDIPYHVSNWRLDEESNLGALEGAIREGAIRAAFLYLAAMDGVLHAHGTESPLVGEKLRGYETRIRRILEFAHDRYGEVSAHLFSDHGMADTRETCDLMARIKRLPLTFGEDYAAVYDSTMARFWFLNERARRSIVEALADEPRGRILDDATLAGYGCDFDDRRYGELFFLMQPGVLINPSHMGKQPLPGMHGYAPEDPASVAAYLTNVAPEVPPVRLDDLFPIMAAEAGLPA
jgi:predicted AlkP superfamily pyrophosphatase or phosphodiesterase